MKSWFKIGFALALPLALLGCSTSNDKSADGDDKAKPAVESAKKEGKGGEDKKPKPAVPVKVAVLESREISSALAFDSVLETESSVEIFSESAGLILEVLAEEGDRVKKGQILARLEDEEQRVDFEESKARYEHESANFKRTQDLHARKLINQQDYDRAAFDLEQMRLRFERARIQLENTIARATVDGVVTKRIAQVGRRVTANRQLFEIKNLDDIFANVNIPGQHLFSIREGLEAEIKSELVDDVRYDAFVKLVSPVVDPSSGTFKVKVALKPQAEIPVYPGMFVSVRIVVDTKEDAVLVPKQAIVHEGDLKYVYRVSENIARKLLLNEGYSSIDYVEALGGFEAGDSVIIMGQNALKDGATVKVITDPISAASSQDLETTEG